MRPSTQNRNNSTCPNGPKRIYFEIVSLPALPLIAWTTRNQRRHLKINVNHGACNHNFAFATQNFLNRKLSILPLRSPYFLQTFTWWTNTSSLLSSLKESGKKTSKFKERIQMYCTSIREPWNLSWVLQIFKLPKDTYARGQSTLILRRKTSYFNKFLKQETTIPVYKTIAVSNIEPFHLSRDFLAQARVVTVVFVQIWNCRQKNG